MKVIMILTNEFNPDPRVYKEAKSLINNGIEVEILCWDRNNVYINKPTENIDGIRVKRFYPKSKYGTGFKQLKGFISFIKEIKTYLNNKQFDVVHGHDIDGCLAGLFVKENKKSVWDMHEFYDGFDYNKIKSYIYELLAKICFSHSDGYLFVTDFQKKKYINKTREDSIKEVIINAPENSVFKNFNRKKSDKLRISFIGNVRTYDTLKNLMLIAEDYIDVQININGDGYKYSNLKKIADKLENTKMTGKFKYQNIKKFYENTDLVYAVYDGELKNTKYSLPVKGLEGIRTLTPIIAEKGTHFGDFIEKHNIGFTINKKLNDIENLLKYLLNNKKLLDYKKENLKKIKYDFTWEKQEKKLLNFYKNIVGDK
jgi:glycosyltransferase involved in cell wall biosynthesis